MKQNPTTAIKCKFSNAVHKILEPNINVKTRERWQHRKKYELTDKEKIELFDKIVAMHSTTSAELTHYQYDKRKKKRIYNDRVARDYNFKKKTKKEEHLKSAKTA